MKPVMPPQIVPLERLWPLGLVSFFDLQYEIVKDNGIIIPFGPRNFKQATTIIAKIELINEYGYKEKWRLIGEKELETLFWGIRNIK